MKWIAFAQGLTPSPALPTRGREQEWVIRAWRESASEHPSANETGTSLDLLAAGVVASDPLFRPPVESAAA